MSVERLPASSSGDWDTYVDAHPAASLYHGSRWLRLVESVFGHEVQRWCLRDATGAIAGVLPIVRLRSHLFGDFGVSLPFVNYGGALAGDAAGHGALVAAATTHAEASGLAHIEFRDAVAYPGFAAVRTDKLIMERALPAAAETLWQELGGKVRAQIRRPQREDVDVDHGRAELLPAFYRVFARNMRDLGTPVYSRAFFSAVIDCEPSATIVVVRVRGEPAAAAFLLGFRERMEIPWASSLRSHNAIGVNMLLYWRCLELAIERGCRVFDFGRSSADSGTLRFKQQWGAQPVPCHWHYWLGENRSLPALNPGNPRYRLAIGLWQRLPVAVANALGPAIVRSLP